MRLLSILHSNGLTFPLENPVLIFSVILFIILFAPLVLNLLKVPHLIGLIIAGAVVGPNGINLLMRDSSVELFGTVGLLYIMFLAGMEIDMADFRKNSRKSIIFGLYTFIIPMILGILSGVYLLGFNLTTSILLASMFASHTLVAYPVISQYGISRNRVVGITLGGTMITDTLALLVLAVIVGMTRGEIDPGFWLTLSISMAIFIAVVAFLVPLLGRWFFKRYGDKVSQYIFVLGVVFVSAYLAELAGVEAIIGAFLAGLALNRLVPNTSPLMNRIEFVGNALFIPFFLIGVGMLIDFRVLISNFEAILVAIVMTVAATTSKYIAAYLTQKTFNFTKDERRVIFGLSNAQAAATLAAVLVGYNVILGETDAGEPIRLLNENILNGTILMILVTCTIASFVAQKGAQNIARQVGDTEEEKNQKAKPDNEKLLVTISHPDTIEELVNLAITLKSKSNSDLYGLNVVSQESFDPVKEREARNTLQRAATVAAATDKHMQELLRYDLNVVNGITNVVKEQKITDIFMGLHHKSKIAGSILGSITEGLLSQSHATIFIYRIIQPLSTVKRHLVIVPPDAEKEPGFAFWIMRIWKLADNTGGKLLFYGQESTLKVIAKLHKKHPVPAEFKEFDDYDDILVILAEAGEDDGVVVVMSRKNAVSYQGIMARIPKYLKKYLKKNNFILVYPRQHGFKEAVLNDFGNPEKLDFLSENIERIDNLIDNISRMLRRN
ncbi:cation:proton antiporter [Alkalitalea saponilacus]|uniref:Kef-type K+ transport system, membrane component KefB n=1 Tax=Alkalitalea saponilacus TaxID=889453 RepID=A0A1T5ASM3_9BACT|nr:cation:proton antiporter [Alkalitalea saponilacus]ASB48612.1 sodium:proton antiporter [Alkalitalea saponilacus]SKB37895.1 Kef-type K+ transport system, membrane component KefB [Alkalitalea saponilacus]